MKQKSKSLLKISILAVFVIIMCYLTMKDHLDEIIYQLSQIHLSDMILLILFSSLMYIFSGIIITLLTKQHEPSYRYKDGIAMSFLTMFTTNVLYSATSKLVQYFLFYTKKIKAEIATSIIAMEFLSYQLLMLLLSFTMMFTNYGYFKTNLPNETGLAWIGIWISVIPLIGIVMILWYPPFQQILYKFLLFLMKHLPLQIDMDTFIMRINEFMFSLQQCKKTFLHNKSFVLKILFFNILRHITKHAIPIIIAFILHLDMNMALAWKLFISSMFLDLWLTAIPIAGKHGFAEAGFIKVFSLLINEANAAAMMLLWRFATFYATTLLGGLILIFHPDISMNTIKNLKQRKEEQR